MAKALVAALWVASTALAQTPPPQKPNGGAEVDELRRDLENTKKELKEIQESIRAQQATTSAQEGWTEEFAEQRRKLELFAVDGYFRVRPDLFYKFDLNRGPDPSGYTLWPAPPVGADQKTNAGVNMRFRFEPTLNVSEAVRIKAQVDALDNVLFGATPEYAFSRSEFEQFTLFSQSQSPPRSAINAIQDSISVKRVYGEVETPFGILRFGRMGSNWGLGMLHNDGDCLDCDYGDTVDRFQLVTEPVPGSGFYVTPMLDFNAEGPTSSRNGDRGQPYDLANGDDSHSFILAVAKRDTPQQERAKIDAGGSILNYGIHFSYRVQRNDPVGFYGAPFRGEGGDIGSGALSGGYERRGAALYIPDVWAKFENKNLKIELEVASVIGNLNFLVPGGSPDDPAALRNINVLEFGAVLRGDYKLLNNALKIGLELGFASGDQAPGLGFRTGRRVGGADNATREGDIDGPQFACASTGGCTDDSIKNFRFNRDYRIDLILWREILGGITDAVYVKPSIDYRLTEGLNLVGAVIYSRTIFPSSAPSGKNSALGIEFNAGARWETEDGFFASLLWGFLIPLDGLKDLAPGAPDLESAHAFRATVGIKF